jgi:hypothetical protein
MALGNDITTNLATTGVTGMVGATSSAELS